MFLPSSPVPLPYILAFTNAASFSCSSSSKETAENVRKAGIFIESLPHDELEYLQKEIQNHGGSKLSRHDLTL